MPWEREAESRGRTALPPPAARPLSAQRRALPSTVRDGESQRAGPAGRRVSGACGVASSPSPAVCPSACPASLQPTSPRSLEGRTMTLRGKERREDEGVGRRKGRLPAGGRTRALLRVAVRVPQPRSRGGRTALRQWKRLEGRRWFRPVLPHTGSVTCVIPFIWPDRNFLPVPCCLELYSCPKNANLRQAFRKKVHNGGGAFSCAAVVTVSVFSRVLNATGTSPPH